VVQRNACKLKSCCITNNNSGAKLCILVPISDQNINLEMNWTAELSLQQSLHLYLAQIQQYYPNLEIVLDLRGGHRKKPRHGVGGGLRMLNEVFGSEKI
jgi:hypothetical protein